MYVDPTGESIVLLFISPALFILDAIVETSILLNSDEYSAENVFNGESVEIPASACFNNPIAQHVYSHYLYNNVKYTDENDNKINYFTGDVYDIVGEWQMHNLAFWTPVAIASQGGLINIGIGIVGAKLTHESAINARFGSSIEAESDRGIVYYPSNILKWINKIGSLNILNWGE